MTAKQTWFTFLQDEFQMIIITKTLPTSFQRDFSVNFPQDGTLTSFQI